MPGDVAVVDGRIAGVALPGTGTGVALPLLVDLQVNGYAGFDFSAASPDEYRVAEAALLADGVGAYLPTVITAPEDDLVDSLQRAASAIAAWPGRGARPLGVHLEGPFLSPERPGVHPPEAMRDPDIEMAQRFLDAGPVALVTLAPERPGALDLIRSLRKQGVVVSLGHTNATSAEAHRGFDAGATMVTHLFNGMRPIGHRDPGIGAAALLRDDVHLGLIADGDHVDAEILDLVARLAPGRVCLVTDAIAGTRAGDGSYRLGGVEVETRDGRVWRADGRIGGSVTPLIESMRRLLRAGRSLAWIARAASLQPLAALGRPQTAGLRPGSPADVLVVGDDLEIVRILRDGSQVDD